MAKKKGKRGDATAHKPKALRKQLRKAEAELGKAVAKRDKAQARVGALSIIADEIRAQLADIDKAAAKAAATEPAAAKPAAAKPAAAKPVATKPVATKPVATKPVATKPVATKPVATKPAAAKPVATKLATPRKPTT